MAAITRTETRVTPWKDRFWDDPTYSAVRIWQRKSGVLWFQMHEWRRPDGTTWAEGWIDGARRWSPTAVPTTETAPGDMPELTAEELQHLIELLTGSNHPLGQSARSKLAAMAGHEDKAGQ